MSDSFVIIGIVLLLIVLISVFFMAWQRPRPMFADRQAVQQVVENQLRRQADAQTTVAWCAAGEDGLFGVFELRDGRYGIVHGRGSGPVVQFLSEGDIKKLAESKDGFGLLISLSKAFKPKIKLVFDDIATAAYARNLLTKPRPSRQ